MEIFVNQDCIDLILEDSATIAEHLNVDNLSHPKVENYLLKIDQFAVFERHFVANDLVGFVAYYCNNKQSKEAFISLILVDTNFRGLNIGQTLLNKVLKTIKDQEFITCSLEVRIDNVNAIHIYNKFGFSKRSVNDHSMIMSMTL